MTDWQSLYPGVYQRHYAPRFYLDWLTWIKSMGHYQTAGVDYEVCIETGSTIINSTDNPEIISGDIMDAIGLNQGLGFQVNTKPYQVADQAMTVTISIKSHTYGDDDKIHLASTWGGILGSNGPGWMNNNSGSSVQAVDTSGNFMRVTTSNAPKSHKNHSDVNYVEAVQELGGITHTITGCGPDGKDIISGGSSIYNGTLMWDIQDHGLAMANFSSWLDSEDPLLGEWWLMDAIADIREPMWSWGQANHTQDTGWSYGSDAGLAWWEEVEQWEAEGWEEPPYHSWEEYWSAIILVLIEAGITDTSFDSWQESQTRYINFEFHCSAPDPANGPDLKIGQLCYGQHYDMPISPNLNLTKRWEFDGIKTITTRGGSTLTNNTYDKAPGWYGGYHPYAKIGGSSFMSGRRDRIGRKVFDLAWDHLEEDNLIPRNEIHGSQGFTEDHFYKVIRLTRGGSLPFIFETNTHTEVGGGTGNAMDQHMSNNLFMARFSQTDYVLKQKLPGVYSTKLKIRESW